MKNYILVLGLMASPLLAKAQSCFVQDQRSGLTWQVSIMGDKTLLTVQNFTYSLDLDSTKRDGTRQYTNNNFCLDVSPNGSLNMNACYNRVSYFYAQSCGFTPQQPTPQVVQVPQVVPAPQVVQAPVYQPPAPQYQAPPAQPPAPFLTPAIVQADPFGNGPAAAPQRRYPRVEVDAGMYTTQLSAFDYAACPTAKFDADERSGTITYELVSTPQQNCLNSGTTRIFDCRRQDENGYCPEITGAAVKLRVLSSDKFIVTATDNSLSRTWTLTNGQGVRRSFER